MRPVAILLLVFLLSGCSDENESSPDDSLVGTFAPVDTIGDVGSGALLRFDAAGVAHIAYRDVTRRLLRLATRLPDGSWSIETIVGESDDSYRFSLAFDRNGDPLVTYQRPTGERLEAELLIARRSAAGWETEVIDGTGGWVGSWSSIGLDRRGNLSVAYFAGYPNYDLRYAYRVGAEWVRESVHTEGESGYAASLDFEMDGTPMIAHGASTVGLMISRRRTHGWETELIAHEPFTGPHLSMTSAGFGRPLIAYRGGTSRDDTDLLVATPEAGGWRTGTVDAVGDVGYHPSLVLDRAGNPWIGYRGGRGFLTVAHADGGEWRCTDMEAAGTIYGSSLAVDPNGRLGIALEGAGDLSFGWIDRMSQPAAPTAATRGLSAN